MKQAVASALSKNCWKTYVDMTVEQVIRPKANETNLLAVAELRLSCNSLPTHLSITYFL